MSTKAQQRPDLEPSSVSTRLPYERPRILFREPLEAVAAACNPTPPGKANPIDCAIAQS